MDRPPLDRGREARPVQPRPLRAGRPRRQRDQKRQREPSQICFSGMRTTRPSSSGVTFSWQVSREFSLGS